MSYEVLNDAPFLAGHSTEKQDKPTKQRLKRAIESLPSGDVKKLQGYKSDYRLRVGDLRVLFSLENETIIIKNILPRGQAYKNI